MQDVAFDGFKTFRVIFKIWLKHFPRRTFGNRRELLPFYIGYTLKVIKAFIDSYFRQLPYVCFRTCIVDDKKERLLFVSQMIDTIYNILFHCLTYENAKLYYLWENAKNIRSHIEYIWKVAWLLPLFLNAISLRYKYIKMVADLWCNNVKSQIFYISKNSVNRYILWQV